MTRAGKARGPPLVSHVTVLHNPPLHMVQQRSVMPESATIDLAAEDVSQLAWDELTMLMTRKDHTDTVYGQRNPDIPATAAPPCTENCCEGCDCDCDDFDHF
jgi:hypothetical protein